MTLTPSHFPLSTFHFPLFFVGSFFLPICLSLLIAYADLHLKGSRKLFLGLRTVSVDMCWCALALNLLVLLPESLPGTVAKVEWHHRPFNQNLFVVLGLLAWDGLILCLCLYEQAERRAMYEKSVSVSKDEEKEARKEEYLASFLAIAALVSEVALLWHAGANGRSLLFKVISSSIIGGTSVVWLLWWDDIRADRQQLLDMVRNAADDPETLISLIMRDNEARQQVLEAIGIGEPLRSVLIDASEQTLQDLVDAIRRMR